MEQSEQEIVKAARVQFLASQPHPDAVVTSGDTYVINGETFLRVSRVIDRICGAFTGTPRTPAIAAQWEAARQDGIDMHEDIDRWVAAVASGTWPMKSKWEFESAAAAQIHQWIVQSKMIPVASEMLVVSRRHKYAGRVDCVMYDPAVRLFCVVDWKRIAVLRPHHLSRYTRQLRLYRFALEEMFPDVAFSPRSIIVHAHDEMLRSPNDLLADDDEDEDSNDDDDGEDGVRYATVARATTGLSLSDETVQWEIQTAMAE